MGNVGAREFELLALVIISIIFVSVLRGIPLKERFFKSSHGALFVLAYVYAQYMQRYTHAYETGIIMYIFCAIVLLALASVFYSFFGIARYRGILVLHVATLYFALNPVAIGSMVLSHSFL